MLLQEIRLVDNEDEMGNFKYPNNSEITLLHVLDKK